MFQWKTTLISTLQLTAQRCFPDQKVVTNVGWFQNLSKITTFYHVSLLSQNYEIIMSGWKHLLLVFQKMPSVRENFSPKPKQEQFYFKNNKMQFKCLSIFSLAFEWY